MCFNPVWGLDFMVCIYMILYGFRIYESSLFMLFLYELLREQDSSIALDIPLMQTCKN